MASKEEDRISEPLVGDGRAKPWVETGLRVWNGTIVVLSVILVVEATVFFWLGVKSPGDDSDDSFSADAAIENVADDLSEDFELMLGSNSTHAVSQGKLEVGLGMALTVVAAWMTGLALTQCSDCCFMRPLMRIFYYVFSCLLISFQIVLVYIIIVIEDWDVFEEDADGVELAALSKTLKDCMWLLVPELVISVFMQIGAMVFHCAWNNHLRMKAAERGDVSMNSGCCGCGDEPEDAGARYQKLFKTFSGGKDNLKLGPKHIARLESMRSYYAQLYMENGLDVPTDLADEEIRRRREYRQKHRRQ